MDPLQSVVAYWRDCVKAESALSQSFAVDGRTLAFHEPDRAVLFPDDHDPFIFSPDAQPYVVEQGRLHNRLLKAHLKGQDIYFGYPLLMFFDHITKRHHVAPLLSIRLEVQPQEQGLRLVRAESTPSVGACALARLGLSPEQIAQLNQDISGVFEDPDAAKLEVVRYMLKQQTHLTLLEAIDPTQLATADTIHPYDGSIIYNCAVLSTGDASSFNVHLLEDLERLAGRNDMETTALQYVMQTRTRTTAADTLPVLPFQFDAYHVQALQRILGSDHAVVTGPPGTGKSQFIANVIINLFLQNKRVLFVSHTGEAVRVVHERINEQFTNLMMQTGKKAIRQDLGRRLDELVEQYNDRQTLGIDEPAYEDVSQSWRTMAERTAYLTESNRLYKQLERLRVRQEADRQRPMRLRQLKAYITIVQSHWLALQLQRRDPSREVLADIAHMSDDYVAQSRAYIQSMYLSRIVDTGLYGELLSYVHAVQNKRTNVQGGAAKSDQYVTAALEALGVWCCTLKSLGASFPLRAHLFDYVIFDEASQIDLPSAAPALYRARRAVVVGDDKQLTHIATLHAKTEEALAERHELSALPCYPAVVNYREASLFQSARAVLGEPELELKNHYRSNATIANLFSSVFYGGRLRVYEPEPILPAGMPGGVKWIDIAGTCIRHRSGSTYNSEEAARSIELLRTFAPLARQHNLTIGVATPYGRQQALLDETATAALDPDDQAHVRILTVHKFQGSEVDVLIFSPVVASKGAGASDRWYAKSEQILNVAISRAKHALYIVGDRDFALRSQSKLRDIAEQCSLLSSGASTTKRMRPMNIFERDLFRLLQTIAPRSVRIEPQYVTGGRFTLDFALFAGSKKLAVELDGRQHEIIGDVPIFEDRKRDRYLTSEGWQLLRIPVHALIHEPGAVKEQLREALRLLDGHA